MEEIPYKKTSFCWMGFFATANYSDHHNGMDTLNYCNQCIFHLAGRVGRERAHHSHF